MGRSAHAAIVQIEKMRISLGLFSTVIAAATVNGKQDDLVQIPAQCNDPTLGTVEEISVFLCDLYDAVVKFEEEARLNYQALQNQVETTSGQLDWLESELIELNGQEQALSKQVAEMSDSVDCGPSGEFEPQCMCNGVLQNGKC